ncbi:MAG: hypothetical protein AAB225_27735 [Acidobacteriota bacterium]
MLILTLLLAACNLAGSELLVGWASTDITPERPVSLAGQFYTRITKHVHDPITATALAMESRSDGRAPEQAVMVSCDVVGIDKRLQEALRERLRQTLPELDGRKVLLNATHTHTAPLLREGWTEVPEGVMTPSEFRAFLTDRLSAAIAQAWRNRRTAGVSWALSHAVIGSNRRIIYADGGARMYGKTDVPEFTNIEGYEDHGVELLFFWDGDKKLTGIVLNVACPSQVVENQSYVSADFWHDVRNELRKRYSKDLFVYAMTGAAGDQAPRVLFRKRAEENLRRRMGGVSETAEIARRLANAVDYVYDAAKGDIRTGVTFVHRVEDLRLPVRKVTDAEVEQARKEYERLKNAPPAERNRFALMSRHQAVIDRHKRQASDRDFPMELHVIRLGDVAIATNPFELFLDFGIRMKARSRAEQTLVVQLACDYAGYLPTARAVAAGGYGAEIPSNIVGPEGGQMLVDRTVEAINSMWE